MKPILFNTSMVQAILEGRKTQTRRLIKPQPYFKDGWWYWDGTRPKSSNNNALISTMSPDESPLFFADAKYQIDDILWVRETWQHTKELNLHPTDENYGYVYKADDQPWNDYEGWKWKPSIHMPKAAARIFLKVTDVRVEKLQDISEKDAIAEGVKIIHMAEMEVPIYRKYNLKKNLGTTNPVLSFKTLWGELYKNWDANPFVWVYEFTRIGNPKN